MPLSWDINFFSSLWNQTHFSHSVLSNSLWPHGLKHIRRPCPSPTPRACTNSCPSSPWCHPTISSSVVPFSSCLQSFRASGCFPMIQFFTSGSQSIAVSASASVLPMNIHDWFPLGLTDLVSLQSKGHLRVFSNTIVQKHQFFGTQLSLWSNSHIHMITGKTITLTICTFVSKVMSLLFNMLSRFVITFFPRRNHLLFHGCSHNLQWFWSPRKWSLSLFPFFPPLSAMKWWNEMPWF